MKEAAKQETRSRGGARDGWRVCVGLFLGLALVKFGNPVILDKTVERNLNEVGGLANLLVMPWPFRWGAWLALLLAVTGWRGLEIAKGARAWPLWAPGAWLAWQLIASTRSVDPELSRLTALHFAVCVGLFYLGWFGLGGRASPRLWSGGLVAGFAAALASGLDQHFGGLEAAREAFFSQPDWRQAPVEFIKKVSSDRIFGTLVYPNALAGAVLIFFPLAAWTLVGVLERFGNIALGVGVGGLGYVSLAVLYWSGSKAGWLLAMGLALVALLHLRFPTRWKVLAVAALSVVGAAAFAYKYADYFKRGATSVVARFDYWDAALRTARDRPFLGAGPGAFQRSYAALKRPDAEMARLAHNDYLEQASDSGWIGFFAYLAIFPASLWRLRKKAREGGAAFAVWLGLLGWSLHGLAEFGLYVPALAWPAFAMLGWLWAWEPAPRPGAQSAKLG